MSGNKPPEVEAEILNIVEVSNQPGTFWAEVAVGAERARVTLAAEDGRGWHVGQTVSLSAGCLFPSASALLSAMDRELDKHGEFRQIDTVQEPEILYLPNAECSKLRAWMLTEIFRQMDRYELACWPRNIRRWHRDFPGKMPPEDAFNLSSHIHAYHIQFGLNAQPSLARYAAASDKTRRGARLALKQANADHVQETLKSKREAVEFLRNAREKGDTRSKAAVCKSYRAYCERVDRRKVSQSVFYVYTKGID